VLHQQPSVSQLLGILLVVVAGAAAQRGPGGRSRSSAPSAVPSEVDLIG